MPDINLSDKRNRDAFVNARGLTNALQVRWVDEHGSQATHRKVLRGTMDCDIDALLGAAEGDLGRVGQALVDGDPEIDIERFGAFLTETSRVYVNPDNELVHRVQQFEIILDPAGEQVERRPLKVAESNTTSEIPLRWTDKSIPKAAAVRRFVFSGKLQITHVNGLTYDFLYGMAKELAEKDELMLVRGGAKGNEPLVFRRGGVAYHGFLEGRIDGDKYALLLHLSNMELKRPGEKADA